MKILLVMGVKYLPARGGAQKYNRSLLEGLVRRGHTCRVVVHSLETAQAETYTTIRAELIARGIQVTSGPDADVYQQGGVEVHTIKSSTRVRDYLAQQLRDFEPTWVLVSEDWWNMLEAVWSVGPERIVYLVQSSVNLPMGPFSFMSNPIKLKQFQQVAGVIAVSHYLREYIRRWSGREAAVVPFMAYGAGPFSNYGNSAQPGSPLIPGMRVPGHPATPLARSAGRGDGRAAQGYVTLINPSAIKGLPIFLDLARRLPDVAFAAVPTWGTTAADRAVLETLPNVTLLAARDNVDELYAQTRVLLVPSLWDEAFGAVVVEAMLRGVPVLASDVGGLPEAKLGVPYVLPVRAIERYEEQVDERGVPIPVVPEQDAGPWEAALREVLSERERYERLSTQSREAAQAFLAALGVEPFEAYLNDLATRPRPLIGEATSEDSLALERLSGERRRLLVRRLRSQGLVGAPKPAPTD